MPIVALAMTIGEVKTTGHDLALANRKRAANINLVNTPVHRVLARSLVQDNSKRVKVATLPAPTLEWKFEKISLR